MTQPSASTFPNHKYDFGESVYIAALQSGGVVEGIWYRDTIWHYHLSNLPDRSLTWYHEDQLESACPRCFAPWDGMTRCQRCGLFPNEVI